MIKNAFSLFPNNTVQQKFFDIIFGVIAPIVCLYFDPYLFHSSAWVASLTSAGCSDTGFSDNAGIFEAYTTFAYTAIGLGVFFLVTWELANNYLKKWAAFFAGIFLIGFMFSFSLGILIFPASLIGLFFCVGFLGFTPFLTAFVYLRNSIQSLQWTREANTPHWSIKVALAALGIAIVIGAPIWMQQHYPHKMPAPIAIPSCGGSE